MSKRKLEKKEIHDILSVIVPEKGIPIDTAKSICRQIRTNIEKQLRDISVYPECIPELKQQIYTEHIRTQVQPGECVGIITAQSIGERQTQMMLNTFHTAGAIQTVVTGVPRFTELINATKKPKGNSCAVYFTRNNDSLQGLRDMVGHSIVSLSLNSITKRVSVYKNKEIEEWYDNFELIYGKKELYEYCISYYLDISILFKYKLSINKIARVIEDEYSDLICIFSPTGLGRLDVYVDVSRIDESDIFGEDDENIVYCEDVVVPKLGEIKLCGLTDITNMIFREIKGTLPEWVIDTEGSNLQALLSLDIVNKTRVMTSNMWEIYEILGIEAARAFLIEEFMNVVASDGNYVNNRHILLLADVMTWKGTITSISRYGMSREQSGPLAKASFEESLDNFLKAGAYGETETTKGVSASIICGKKAVLGTGLPSIHLDVDLLQRLCE